MIIDMHTHIPKIDDMERLDGFMQRALVFLFKRGLGFDDINEYMPYMIKTLKESEVQKAVILALDGAYDEEGNRLKFDMFPNGDNKDVLKQIEKEPDIFLFGTSVHPYRKDALDALLAYIKKRGKVGQVDSFISKH